MWPDNVAFFEVIKLVINGTLSSYFKSSSFSVLRP